MYKEFFSKYKSFTLFRFLIAGIINTIVGFGLGVLFLTVLPFHFSLSIFLATCLGVCFNYFMSSRYVFNSSSSTSKIVLFFIIYIIMYLINMLFMFVLINEFNLSDIISYVISAPFIIVLTYLLQKKIVFQNEKNINHNSNL